MLKAPIADQRAFVDLILKLNKDQKLYEKTQEEALEWAKGWDWDKNSEQVLNLIVSGVEHNM